MLFRGSAPTMLQFGTSGLRGLVDDMTDLEVYINTTGFLKYIQNHQMVKNGDSICLAGDLRPSTENILRAVATAIRNAGFKVRYFGRIPTPALTFVAMQDQQASVMVTGSHIPFDRNGVKFNKPTGEVLKSDESGILSKVQLCRHDQYSLPKSKSLFEDSGFFKTEVAPELPDIEYQAAESYLQRYKNFFPAGYLKGRHLMVYQHSAVGRDLLVELLESFGAKVTTVGRSETFVPIDTEDISSDTLNKLQAYVEKGAKDSQPVDALISTDGDSDRPLVCGISGGRKIGFINGDLLGLLVADFLEADNFVVPISTNDAVDLYCEPKGIELHKTKIGSPHVISTMQLLLGQGKQMVVGWEANGGFLVGSNLEQNACKLSSLMTRDAFLPILTILYSSVERQVSLVNLSQSVPMRFGKAGLIDNFPKKSSLSILKIWKPLIKGLLDWNIVNSEIHLHLEENLSRLANSEECLAITCLIEKAYLYFSRDKGYAPLQGVNYIDGVRFRFQNGDIAHIRPSGNAPQIRFYAVASSQGRANSMVAHAIVENGGILRCMQTDAEK
jgi:phosphomannomutase